MRPPRSCPGDYAREAPERIRSGVGLGEQLELLLADDHQLVRDGVDDLELQLVDEVVALAAGEAPGVVDHVQVVVGADVGLGDVSPARQGGSDPVLVGETEVGVVDVGGGEVHLELHEAGLVRHVDPLG